MAAEDLWFPSGMVLTADGTLIVAETLGGRLTAFDVAADGALSGRRTFAQPRFVPEPAPLARRSSCPRREVPAAGSA